MSKEFADPVPLTLNVLGVQAEILRSGGVAATADRKALNAQAGADGIRFAPPVTMSAGQTLEVRVRA